MGLCLRFLIIGCRLQCGRRRREYLPHWNKDWCEEGTGTAHASSDQDRFQILGSMSLSERIPSMEFSNL